MRRTLPRSVLWALLLFGLLHTADAFGCFVAPAEQNTHYTNLIDRTPLIVLAEAVAAEELPIERVGDDFSLPQRVRYNFSVIETLKGQSESKMTLTFYRHDRRTPPIDHDFDHHRDSVFWDRQATRQWNKPDCQMNPVFFVGSRYLLFLNGPYHWRSFERISAADDRWLTTVRARIRSGAEFSQPILEWLRDKYGLILYRVERCAIGHTDKATLSHVETLEGFGSPASDWQPIFAGRNRCRKGLVVMAIHYSGYPEQFVTTYPVIEDHIDLTRAITEIKLLGSRRVSIKELKAFLR